MKQSIDFDHARIELYDKLKIEERNWQDEIGNDLIEESYKCDGSRLVYENQFHKIINQIKRTQIPMHQEFTIIEIGCGRGQFLNKITEVFHHKKIRIFGLDLSSKLIEVKQKYKNRIHWIIADGENLPLADNSFDAVIYNGALHHMPDFKKAMHETFRIVRPDGHIILYEPISTFFSRSVHRLLDPFVFKKTKYESPIDEYCKDNFRLECLKKIIIDAGYIYAKSWHDFLAYPVTGCYAGSFFSHKPGLIKGLLHVEDLIQKIPIVRNVCHLICWRLLMNIQRGKNCR